MIPPGLCMCGCGEPTAIATVTVRTRNMVKGEPMRYKKGHCLRVRGIRNERNRNTLHFSDEQITEMVALYRHGWSCDQLAVRFGCLSGSIQKRLLAAGVEMRPKKRWRKTATLHSNGYVLWGGSYVHRIVAAAWLGRDLRPGEHVHHKDGDKRNNHPDNLEVMPSASAHMKAETWRVWWTEERIARLRELRESGLTSKQIAADLGTTKCSVDNAVCKYINKTFKRYPSRKAARQARVA